MSDVDADLRRVGARVAGHAVLREIRTFSMSAELDHLPASDMGLSYEFEPVIDHEQTNDSVLVIDGQYRLSVREHREGDDGEPDPEGVPLAEIRFTLSSLYALREFDAADAQPFSDAELRAFAASTGQFALYPYARALVSDLVARLGLPPLTLPMLKIDIAKEMDRGTERAVISSDDASDDSSKGRRRKLATR